MFTKYKNIPYHPCMNVKAHGSVARIHLPVASRCNIVCAYCERKTGIHAEGILKPGMCDRVITPHQAAAEAKAFIREYGEESIVGIAGPGDPLANDETFTTLSLLKSMTPRIRLCLCTNGLNLSRSVGQLNKSGVEHISVTINGIDPEIVEKIHPTVFIDGEKLTGKKAAATLIEKQLKGVIDALTLGIFVKINTVVIPGINENHIFEIAKTVSGLGAGIMNLMPLIPGGIFKNMDKPSQQLMDDLTKQCGNSIALFTKCRQCRADARGIPGKEECTWKKTA